jgi:hypothetical protein
MHAHAYCGLELPFSRLLLRFEEYFSALSQTTEKLSPNQVCRALNTQPCSAVGVFCAYPVKLSCYFYFFKVDDETVKEISFDGELSLPAVL